MEVIKNRMDFDSSENNTLIFNQISSLLMGKKYTGAAGDFAPEMPKRAPENPPKHDFEGDPKIESRPGN